MEIVKKEKYQNFWKKVDKKEENQCWEWKGFITNNGYGQIQHDGKMEYVHRLSWIIHNSNIPEGLYVLHTCDNRSCVNPNHLFLGTQQDNINDMKNKGRERYYSVLTQNEIDEIREIYSKGKSTHRKLSEQFDVSKGTIYYILQKET